MKYSYALGMVLLLVFAVDSGYCQYKDLVSSWEKWSPPSYTAGNPVRLSHVKEHGQHHNSDPPEHTEPHISRHRIRQSKASQLIQQGQFLQAGFDSKNQVQWTIFSAQDAIKAAVSLRDLEGISRERNPGILAAKAAFLAELEGFGQVADLNAVLSRYSAFTQGVMTGVGPMNKGADMSGIFPFPGQSSLKTGVIVENAAMAALDVHITVRDTVTSVRKAYWTLTLIHEKLKILGETLRLYEHLHDIASTMYKTGKTRYQDVIQISIKTKILDNQITTLKQEKKAAEIRILALLDLPAGSRMGRPGTGSLALDLPEADVLIDRAVQQRQEIRKMDHAINKMELMIEMSEGMVLPSRHMGLSDNPLDQMNTTGTWSDKKAFTDRGPSASMGAGQPLKPWFGTTASWLAQTRKKLAALRLQRRNLALKTLSDVQSGWVRLDDVVRTYHLYADAVVEMTASALDVSTKEYEAGRISFADTAAAYDNWLDVRLSLAKAAKDVGVFRSDLEKIVGSSF